MKTQRLVSVLWPVTLVIATTLLFIFVRPVLAYDPSPHTGIYPPCFDCHLSQNNPPYSPRPCSDCHNGANAPAVATHGNLHSGGVEASFKIDCNQCHNPHGTTNLSLIRESVWVNPSQGVLMPVVFTARTGPNSYDDGTPDSICVVCHINPTNSGFPMSNHTGGNHGGANYEGQNCTTCHPHDPDEDQATVDGFMPAGGCTDCHAQVQDNGDGIPAGGRRAVVDEFGYSSHHVQGQVEDGDCVACHALNTHMNGYLQLKNVDSAAIYDEPAPAAYRNPTTTQVLDDLTAFCLGCHDGDVAPATPFSDGQTPPLVSAHTNGSGGTEGPFSVGCVQCHGSHGSNNLAIIKSDVLMDPAAGLNTGPVVFTALTGNNSFDEADTAGGVPESQAQTADDICATCHNNPNNPGYPMNGHFGGDDHGGIDYRDQQCTDCHAHANGFIHGGGGSGAGCVECHGHDAGTPYDPDGSYPYTPDLGTASQGRGSAKSHSTHTENDSDDIKGPGIYCDSCHDANQIPYFKSGADSNGDGKYNLAETDVCDDCHSPGGAFDGVNNTAGSVGAKDNWDIGVYTGSGSATTLQAGKDKWCAGCHDSGLSVVKSVTAPNVAGDIAQTWGFYVSGHGTDEGSALCDNCHDLSLSHTDGDARTYAYTGPSVFTFTAQSYALYQTGYRLKLINGDYPLRIPKVETYEPISETADFKLCFQCHSSEMLFDSTLPYATNFNNSGPNKAYGMAYEDTNSHRSHVLNEFYGGVGHLPDKPSKGVGQMIWNSDWDMSTGDPYRVSSNGFIREGTDSIHSCPACHNVHGSTYPAMIRDGKLVGKTKADGFVFDGLPFAYLVENGSIPNVTSQGANLSNSIGAVIRATSKPNGLYGNTVYDGVCWMGCHRRAEAAEPAYVTREGYSSYDCYRCHPFSGRDDDIDYFRQPGAGQECLLCHAGAVDNGDGLPAGGRQAVVDKFGRLSHHVITTTSPYTRVVTSDDCKTCHAQETGNHRHMDGYVTLWNQDDGSAYQESSAGAYQSLNNSADLNNLTLFCSGCHDGDGAQRLPSPMSPFSDGQSPVSVSTHSNGSGGIEDPFSTACAQCHDSHGSDNLSLIKANVLVNPTLGATSGPVVFTSLTGTNSFDDGTSPANSRICVLCHGNSNNPGFPMLKHTGGLHDGVDAQGADCTTCHQHQQGFTENDCLGCHQQEMGSRRAVAPDFNAPNYTQGPHHPINYTANETDPTQNNCLFCHDVDQGHGNGTVDMNLDPDRSGSSEWNGTYPSWWCVDCHDGNGPATLAGRTSPDKQVYFVQPGVHYNGGSVSVPYCGSCHQGDPQNPYERSDFYAPGLNGHTVRNTALFFSDAPSSGFTTSHAEESRCYECHGGFMNSRRYDVDPREWMENIYIVYSGQVFAGRYYPIVSTHGSDVGDDGVVVCRQCHDPHSANRYQNQMIIDPDNPTTPWPWSGQWTTDDGFCQRCHDGSQAATPTHSGINTSGKSCIDCHAVHGSTLPNLQYLSETEIASVTVTPAQTTTTVSVGSTTPLAVTVTGLPTDRVVPLRWQVTPLSGGSTGTVVNATVPLSIPEPSLPYQGAGGVTGTLTVNGVGTIYDVDVYVDITHGQRGDIAIFLTHNGQTLLLRRDSLGWGPSPYTATWYDSERLVSDSTAPMQNLAAFYGNSADGDWALTVVDYAGNNMVGTLNSWSLQFNEGVVGTVDQSGQFTAIADGVARVESIIGGGQIVHDGDGNTSWANVKENTQSGTITVTVGAGSLALMDSTIWSALMSSDEQPPSDHGIQSQSNGEDCKLCHTNGVPAAPKIRPGGNSEIYLPVIMKRGKD